MSVNLFEDVDACWLVAKLCVEAKIGLTGEMGNDIMIKSATYDVDKGLVITDGDDNKFRLNVIAILV